MIVSRFCLSLGFWFSFWFMLFGWALRCLLVFIVCWGMFATADFLVLYVAIGIGFLFCCLVLRFADFGFVYWIYASLFGFLWFGWLSGFMVSVFVSV